jgi:hypothetical protein
MPTNRCTRCGAPITYAVIPGRGSLPFDPEPEPEPTSDGYVIRYGDNGTRYAFDGRERQHGEATYAFHLAVCPIQRKVKEAIPFRVKNYRTGEYDTYPLPGQALMDAAAEDDPGELDEPPFCAEHKRYACACQDREIDPTDKTAPGYWEAREYD